MKELIDHGIIRDVNSAPQGFEHLTKDQFGTILQFAHADPARFCRLSPVYADARYSRERKRFEFRRSIFKHDIKVVVVYITSPVGQVAGEFKVDDIITDDVDALWDRTETQAGD